MSTQPKLKAVLTRNIVIRAAQLDMPVNELADRCGWTRRTMRDFIKGRFRYIDPEFLETLCGALHWTPGELLTPLAGVKYTEEDEEI